MYRIGRWISWSLTAPIRCSAKQRIGAVSDHEIHRPIRYIEPDRRHDADDPILWPVVGVVTELYGGETANGSLGVLQSVLVAHERRNPHGSHHCFLVP